MKDKIIQLLAKGDSHLKEAKTKFWIRQTEQCDGSGSCCKAIRKYLEAYEHYLFPGKAPVDNFHVLVRTIVQRDPDFQKFYDKLFEVKCFSEESKRKKEDFFLYDDEKDAVIKISLDIRDYIAKKIQFDQQFLSDFIGTPFMAI
ncbi:MAG TPA: hypothetical protein PKH79_04160 [Prolixibacteraceae bacterium]|nr:hypothetical protein [Prolixibacteraceae bacterium]